MPARRLKTVPPNSSRRNSHPSPTAHPFDVAFGTDTGGLIPGVELRTGTAADRFVTAYYAVAPSIFRALLDLWQTRAEPLFPLDRYTFLDIGCGKGRALLLAAANPFHEAVGIELNPALAAIARANLEAASTRSDPLAPIRLIEGDALTSPLPSTPTLVFLFHPFEAPAVRRLLRLIEAQFSDRVGHLDLLYVNAEHAAVLDRSPAFTCVWQGRVPMSTEDHLADLKEIASQLEYGSTGDELCAIYRFSGRPKPDGRPRPHQIASAPVGKFARSGKTPAS